MNGEWDYARQGVALFVIKSFGVELIVQQVQYVTQLLCRTMIAQWQNRHQSLLVLCNVDYIPALQAVQTINVAAKTL